MVKGPWIGQQPTRHSAGCNDKADELDVTPFFSRFLCNNSALPSYVTHLQTNYGQDATDRLRKILNLLEFTIDLESFRKSFIPTIN